MIYRGETKLLKFSVFVLYEILAPPARPPYPIITSTFGDIEEAFVPASSKFKFSENRIDYLSDPRGSLEYGEIMFNEFE
jgi:hypothetical protein